MMVKLIPMTKCETVVMAHALIDKGCPALTEEEIDAYIKSKDGGK